MTEHEFALRGGTLSSRPRPRTIEELLIGIQFELEAIHAALDRANSVERTGAVSSVELKFLANGTPQPVLKMYAGSVAPVDEAIEAYGRTILMAEQAAREGWAQTVEVLQAERMSVAS